MSDPGLVKALYGGSLNERVQTYMNLGRLRYQKARSAREFDEGYLPADEHLDDLGWDIFEWAIRMDAHGQDAAVIAMDGTLIERMMVRSDLSKRYLRHLHHEFPDMQPAQRTIDTAAEHLAYWREHLSKPTFVYFIQADAGAVKIGRAKDPESRLRQLQTGSPDKLQMLHVVPGDAELEASLHRRFGTVRIRGEWFGAEYLPIILTYADGLAAEAVANHDGSSTAPTIVEYGDSIRDRGHTRHLRAEIQRLWKAGHRAPAICQFCTLEPDELEAHLNAMRSSPSTNMQAPKLTPVQHAIRKERTDR